MSGEDDRQARLAAALRTNLRRRKAAAAVAPSPSHDGRKTPSAPGPEPAGPAGADETGEA